jgi:4-hydroxy-tetrahydrodipicolinate synthase
MKQMQGIWIPLITPISGAEVDISALQKLAGHYFSAGVNGLVVCGSTGEASMLSEGEKAQILAAVQDVVPVGFPVMMGIGGSYTQRVAEKLTRLEKFGTPPDAYLISAPAYVRPSQEGIALHFRALCEATEQPIVLYNIPARTGVHIETSTLSALNDCPQIIGMKDCSGRLEQAARILRTSPLRLMCGDDHLLSDFLSIGGHGAISAAAHIRPDLFCALYAMIRQGETARSLILFQQLFPLIRLLHCEPNPAPLKAALSLLGMAKEEFRLPMTPMSASGKQYLARELEKVMQIPAPQLTGISPAKRGTNLVFPSCVV